MVSAKSQPRPLLGWQNGLPGDVTDRQSQGSQDLGPAELFKAVSEARKRKLPMRCLAEA